VPFDVVPFDRDDLPPALVHLAEGPAGAAVLERWRAADRSRRHPRLIALRRESEADSAARENRTPEASHRPRHPHAWRGAALVSARPGTASLTIADVLTATDCPDPQGTGREVIEAVVAYARHAGIILLAWEGSTATETVAASCGFVPVPAPASAESGSPAPGHVRWLVPQSPVVPHWYGQSTTFTCGAAAALMGQVLTGAIGEEGLTREAELRLWQNATNFPVCEPVRLGLAIAEAWPGTPVEVTLDTDRPVMLGHLEPGEQEWRAVLQAASRADAAARGVPVSDRRLTVGEIREAVGRGARVLLLVSLERMLGYPVPHWVLVHAAVPGALVLTDPWVEATTGETWLDATAIPVPDAELDAMAAVDLTGIRGAVIVG
jgi:hypothetical protein